MFKPKLTLQKASRPALPTRSRDAWECGFPFHAPRDVRAVSCRNGRVLAGGDHIYLLKAGAQSIMARERPEQVGPIVAVATEPRSPFRYAVASDLGVSVFIEERAMRIRPRLPGLSATHLAWAGTAGPSLLYIRWSDGEVLRTDGNGDIEEMEGLPPIDALASDDAGVLAMISVSLPAPGVYVMRDDEHAWYRPLGLAFDATEPVHLAVADIAVAVAIGTTGAWKSRGPEDPFDRVEVLGSAGPLAFEGTHSQAALFGASLEGGAVRIVRVEADGAAVRVADVESDGPISEGVHSLSWDSQRRMLWAALPTAGLVMCTAPSAKRGKLATPS